MPSAIFWGTVAGVLNFVPFLGALLSTALIAFASLGAATLNVPPLIVPLAFFGLHLIEAEFVTPTVLGRRLTLNPLFMIIAVLVFGTAWGIGGAFLAVLLLIVAKVSFAAMPGVAGWSQVLGRRRQDLAAARLVSTARQVDDAPPGLDPVGTQVPEHQVVRVLPQVAEHQRRIALDSGLSWFGSDSISTLPCDGFQTRNVHPDPNNPAASFSNCVLKLSKSPKADSISLRTLPASGEPPGHIVRQNNEWLW